MNEQIKQKWIEALTSGEYAQTKGCLNDGNGMCCLGVLSDLYRKEQGGEWKLSDAAIRAGESRYALQHEGMTFGDDEEIGVLPAKVRDWAELQECIPNLPFVPKDLFEPQCETNTLEELEHYNYLESLAGANDAGITFPQIADLIKAFV